MLRTQGDALSYEPEELVEFYEQQPYAPSECILWLTLIDPQLKQRKRFTFTRHLKQFCEWRRQRQPMLAAE